MGRSKEVDVLSARFAVAITMIVVFLVACKSPDPSGDVAAGPGGPDALEVTAVDGAFEPDRLELTAGDRVELEVTNEGSGTHNFTIEELGLSTGAIEAGGVATARFVVPDGQTTFACTLHPGWRG
jgi:plastocyanin